MKVIGRCRYDQLFCSVFAKNGIFSTSIFNNIIIYYVLLTSVLHTKTGPIKIVVRITIIIFIIIGVGSYNVNNTILAFASRSHSKIREEKKNQYR